MSWHEGRLRVGNISKAVGLPAAIAVTMALITGCAGSAVSTEKTDAGYSAAEEANYQEAESLFQEAVSGGEDAVMAYRGLGIAQMGLAEYDEAAASFESALASTDDRMPETVLDLLQYLAGAQYRQQKYDDAIETSSEILSSDAENVSAYFYTGASRLHQGSQDEAKANFDQAISIRPQDYELYLDIYSVYEDTRLSGVGDEYLQTALGIAPSTDEDYYHVGQIYYYLEQYSEAASALAVPVGNDYGPALSLMGRVYLAQDDTDNANATFLKLLSQDKDSADAYNGLALCALESQDPDKALDYITQGLELSGGEGKQELYFNEIVAYEKKLDFLTARDKCRTYVEMYPADEAGQKELKFLNSRG